MRFAYFLLGANLLLLAVLLIHWFLYRKISARGLYALWLIPALRLLIPFGWIELPQTNMTGTVLVTPYRIMEKTWENEKEPARAAPMTDKKADEDKIPANNTLYESVTSAPAATDTENMSAREIDDQTANTKHILLAIWGIGSAACLCYVLIVNGNMRRSIKGMELLKEEEMSIPVYCSKTVYGSCLFGLFRPCIIVNCDVAENPKLYPYLLRHEKMHYCQRDPIWTALRILLCIAYWWDPLVWIAAICAQEDGELACDERALAGLPLQEKQAYGYALLEVFQSGARQQLFYDAVRAGGNRSTMKRRIAAIAAGRQGKLSLSIVVYVILVSLFLFGICLPKNTYAANTQGNKNDDEHTELQIKYQADEEEPITEKSSETDTNNISRNGSTEAGTITKKDMDSEEDTKLLYLSPLSHQDGYQVPNIQFVTVTGLSEEYPSDEERNNCDMLAQRALQELYDLTGVQITECVYTANTLGTFYFAKSEKDLQRSRIFYSYQFAMEEGIISSFSIANARRVWFSDVQQLLLPENAAEMESNELALWFLQHSGLCPEGYVAQTGLVYETEPELIKVTMSDGSFYEVHLDMEILAVEAVYGPYPAQTQH